MIKIENTDVFGFEAAIRGMRNPMNSWDQSDSNFSCKVCDGCVWEKDARVETDETEDWIDTTSWCPHSPCRIGENDMKLMKNLAKAGSDHAKYLRMINVTMDVTAPLYWWKEFDTYKVGTVANSCSTMHKIHAKEFTMDDFSHEHLIDFRYGSDEWVYDDVREERYYPELALMYTIKALNFYRNKYLECAEALKCNNFETWNDGMACKTAQKHYWWQMIQLLPSSYNQKRTVQLNYEVLRHQYHARKNHKLDCWHTYCDWIKTLPYAKELIIGEE